MLCFSTNLKYVSSQSTFFRVIYVALTIIAHLLEGVRDTGALCSSRLEDKSWIKLAHFLQRFSKKVLYAVSRWKVNVKWRILVSSFQSKFAPVKLNFFAILIKFAFIFIDFLSSVKYQKNPRI